MITRHAQLPDGYSPDIYAFFPNDEDDTFEPGTIEDDELVGVAALDKTHIAKDFLPEPVLGLDFNGLMVHPDYRRRGIGGALTSWRTRIADEFHLPSFTETLYSTNTIEDKYLALGFKVVQGGYYREPQN